MVGPGAVDDGIPEAHGDLRRFALPKLLNYLKRKQLLGRLELSRSSDGWTGQIYFRDGMAVRADFSSSQDLLGRVLLERHLINEEALERSLAEASAGGELHGQVLRRLGLIDESALATALQIQLHRKLVRLFALTDAQFRVVRCDHGHGLRGEERHVRADPFWVINHGVRTFFRPERIGPELERLAGKELRLTPDWAGIEGRYSLDPEETELARSLSTKPQRFEQLLAGSGPRRALCERLLYVLWVSGAVVAGDETSSSGVSGDFAATCVTPQPGQADATARAGAPTSFPQPGFAGRRAPSSPTGPQRRVTTPAGGSEPSRGGLPPGAEERRAASRESPPLVIEPSAASRCAGRVDRTGPGRPAPTPPGGATAGAEALSAAIETSYANLSARDHFAVLELERGVSHEAVRDAYLRLAKLFHPDRCHALNLDCLVPKAGEIFRRISEAHTVLTDPEQRQRYEAELDGKGAAGVGAQEAVRAEIAFQKGLVLHRKRAWADALAAFEEAHRLCPREGEHLAWIAWTMLSNPNTSREGATLGQIRARLQEAVALSPQSPACAHFLGEAYLALGDETRAAHWFNRVLELRPGHLEAQRHMRVLHMREEKKPKGFSLFGRRKD